MLSYNTLRQVEETGELCNPLLEEVEDDIGTTILQEVALDELTVAAEIENCSPTKPENKIEISDLEEKIQAKIQSSKPFSDYLTSLSKSEKTWDPTKDFKVMVNGQRKRNYSEEWKAAAENFLLLSSGFKTMNIRLEDCDKLIPVSYNILI